MSEFLMKPELSARAADVCRQVVTDEELVHTKPVQSSLRRALADELGGEWAVCIEQVRSALAVSPYAVVVRGGDATRARDVLAAFAVGFGTMTNPYHGLVPGLGALQEVVAKGASSPDRVWLWHTDSCNWPSPNDYSAFACLSAAPEGGATETLSLDTLRKAAGWDDGVLCPLWEAEFPWPIEAILGGGTSATPPITAGRLRFRRELMTAAAARWDDDEPFRAAVRRFAELCDAAAPDSAAVLAPGDLLIFDNRRVLHRSGPVTDPGGVRRLLRTKIYADADTDTDGGGGAAHSGP
jgi:hypothetical protein